MVVGRDVFWFKESGDGFGSSAVCGLFKSDGKGKFNEIKLSMRRDRLRCAFINLKNKFIFACGGRCDSTAEKYDMEKGQWRLIVPNRYGREFCNGIALKDSIYVFGGFDMDRCRYRNSVEILDTRLLGQPNAQWQIFKLGMDLTMRILKLAAIPDYGIVIFATPHHIFSSQFENEKHKGMVCMSFNTETLDSQELEYDFSSGREVESAYHFKDRSLLVFSSDGFIRNYGIEGQTLQETGNCCQKFYKLLESARVASDYSEEEWWMDEEEEAEQEMHEQGEEEQDEDDHSENEDEDRSPAFKGYYTDEDPSWDV